MLLCKNSNTMRITNYKNGTGRTKSQSYVPRFLIVYISPVICMNIKPPPESYDESRNKSLMRLQN